LLGLICHWFSARYEAEFCGFLATIGAAQMGPTDLKNWAAKNYGGVLIKSSWWFLLGTRPSYRVTKCRLSIWLSETKL